jgi:hypothetical protein
VVPKGVGTGLPDALRGCGGSSLGVGAVGLGGFVVLGELLCYVYRYAIMRSMCLLICIFFFVSICIDVLFL